MAVTRGSTTRALECAMLVVVLAMAAREAAGAVPEIAYRQPQIFEVGGSGAVWKAHSSPTFFEDWAADLTFRVGDVLQFNVEALVSLYQVPNETYNSCGAAGIFNIYTFAPYSNPKPNVQLLETGMNYFVSLVNCRVGTRVKVNVVNVTNIPAPPSAPLPGPPRAPKFFQVAENGSAWNTPSTPEYFIEWANTTSFFVGDKLVFNFSNWVYDFTPNLRDISIVPYASWEECYISQADYIWRSKLNTTYELTAPGTLFFMATNPWFCLRGMRFVAHVYPASAPSPNSLPPALAPASPSPISLPTTPTSTPSGTPSEAPEAVVPPSASPPSPPAPSPDALTPPLPPLPPLMLPLLPSSGKSLGARRSDVVGALVGVLAALEMVVALLV